MSHRVPQQGSSHVPADVAFSGSKSSIKLGEKESFSFYSSLKPTEMGKKGRAGDSKKPVRKLHTESQEDLCPLLHRFLESS